MGVLAEAMVVTIYRQALGSEEKASVYYIVWFCLHAPFVGTGP